MNLFQTQTRPLIFTVLCIMVISTGCQNKTKQISPDLKTVNLLRGELLLCSSEQFGEVSFAVDCSDNVQETFDLALSLLHSFEYDEAEKSFVKVIDEDPGCAMAYWGVAMSNFHSLWNQSGTEFLEKGATVLKIARGLEKTERAADYINAISVFFKDWQTVDRRTRISLFEKQMENVYKKYVDDKEAAIFYALALRASADPADKSYKNQRKSGKILESLFPDQPNHPGIAHYIIHNYDYPELAELALPTARRYAQIAPSSAHAQHMPSHIFTRLGLWQESIQSNLRSTEAALCYSTSVDTASHWVEELHGMDYLVYAYLQTGETEKATEQLEYLKNVKKVFGSNFAISYATAAIPARIVLETRQWQEAANLKLPDSIQIDWQKFPWQKSLVHFTRAMGSSRLGDIKSAEKELGFLQSHQKELLKNNDLYYANQLMIQIKITQAWINLAKKQNQNAILLMKEAVVMENNTTKHPVTPGEVLPAGELLGDLFLAMNKYDQALKAYEDDMNKHPNRFNGFYGAAVAARGVNNYKKAKEYFEELIKLTGTSDCERIELKEAKDFVAEKKLLSVLDISEGVPKK